MKNKKVAKVEKPNKSIKTPGGYVIGKNGDAQLDKDCLVPCDYGHYNKQGVKCKQCEESIKECMVGYNEYWKELVETDGKLDINKVCRELADYQDLADNVSKVYSHITDGKLSKPRYDSETVISVFEEIVQDRYIDRETTVEDIMDIINIKDGETKPKEKLEEIKRYLEEL